MVNAREPSGRTFGGRALESGGEREARRVPRSDGLKSRIELAGPLHSGQRRRREPRGRVAPPYDISPRATDITQTLVKCHFRTSFWLADTSNSGAMGAERV